MSKFKVGDRVRFVCDGYNHKQNKGDEATVVSLDNDGDAIVDTDDVGETCGWRDSIELVFRPEATIHYTPDSTGKDYLARCEDTFSREEMIGAYRFTLGKYVDRMGKKTGEPVEKELAKIIDYATRAKAWLERSE